MNIKEMLSSDETLFKNEEVFDFDYTPDQFNHRDEQLKAIASCIKPVFKGMKGINTLLLGKPGTGKTSAINTIFEQMGDSDKSICVHINCQMSDTPYKIFSQIHKKIYGYVPPETGVPLSRIYDKIYEKLTKEKKSLLVALDDIQYIIGNKHADKTLYELLRAYERSKGAKTTLICISNENLIHKLDDKVRSVFQPEEIRFHPYTLDQIYNILDDRITSGLYPNVLSSQMLKTIVKETSERGDLRFGINAIKKSVLKAESDASRKVMRKHLIFDDLDNQKKLTNEESLILDILSKKERTSGDLFEEFNKNSDTSYTTFYRIIESLESKGRISTEKTGARGKTRVIKKVE